MRNLILFVPLMFLITGCEHTEYPPGEGPGDTLIRLLGENPDYTPSWIEASRKRTEEREREKEERKRIREELERSRPQEFRCKPDYFGDMICREN